MSRERWEDPCPRGGLVEHVACTIKARFGAWPADFLGIVDRAYRGRVPQRFEDKVAELARTRPWELPDPPPGIVFVFVDADGFDVARFTSAELDEA